MKNKRGFGIIIGGFMKKRVIGLIFLTYIIISLFFLFRYIWIRYETMNIAENIMCNIITGEKRNIKIFSSNRLINVLKKYIIIFPMEFLPQIFMMLQLAKLLL